ncbi:hypothetical protein [Pseudotabrizicola sp. 4114]|uniref:hypothetical protein n=1 Tax=Pseudotabrizicola sp. 4114 TaxID=2817731 RepID=UPI002864401C|nr:hypothetical protein [Pseudorhodobacter sp. 4114]
MTMLQERLDDGELLLWEPQLPGDSCGRVLFLTKEINDEFDPDVWTDPNVALRYANLEADFDRYVSGWTVPVGLEPYSKGDNAFMARIDPIEYGMWAIRSVAPKPALRVFGAFYQRDVFVALLTRCRKDLGGPGSREWANAREAAIAKWDCLFPSRKRLFGDELNVYFSEKALTV